MHASFWAIPDESVGGHRSWLALQQHPPRAADLETFWYSVNVDGGGSVLLPHRGLERAAGLPTAA